jgi:MFS transporter, FHS family, L-fucose permease
VGIHHRDDRSPIPSVRAIFSLTYAESMPTHFAFFVANGIVSLPAAALVVRLGMADR